MSAEDFQLTGFLQYGPAAASARTRYFEWIRRTGVHAETYNFLGEATASLGVVRRRPAQALAAEIRLRNRIRQPMQRALILRGASPFSNGGAESLICRSAALSVYDFDDALMHVPEVRLRRLWSRAATTRSVVASVDRVIAGNEFLAEWAKSLNSDVRVIPTCIDPDDYTAKIDFSMPQCPRIVWLGSPSTEKYLDHVAPVLASINRKHGANLTIISGNYPLSPTLAAFSRRVPWRPGIEKSLAEYDLAIAPLTEGPIERGKSAYKILQYAATGLPVVGSPVGTNAQVLSSLGYLACTSTATWVDALNDLITSPDRDRQAMGNEARRCVMRDFSYYAWQKEWLRALDLSPGSEEITA